MPAPDAEFNPEHVEMSLGDHLEELRRRILIGLIAMVPAALLCLFLGKQLLAILCGPLMRVLQKYDINPQLYTDQPTDAFMVYIKLSFIAAACIAGPWFIYQLWQFVRTGLYPREQKYVTKYIPLSIILMICGMLFVYFVVLPLSLDFFVGFNNDIKLPTLTNYAKSGDAATTTQPTFVQAIPADPDHPAEYQTWFNTSERRLKLYAMGSVRIIPFGPSSLVAAHFDLSDYLDMVLQMLVIFGLAFQLPLVVLALVRIGIVEVATFKRLRRYVYLALCIIAAAIAPGDAVTVTIGLLIPLIFLYEMGIFMAVMGEKKDQEKTA